MYCMLLFNLIILWLMFHLEYLSATIRSHYTYAPTISNVIVDFLLFDQNIKFLPRN